MRSKSLQFETMRSQCNYSRIPKMTIYNWSLLSPLPLLDCSKLLCTMLIWPLIPSPHFIVPVAQFFETSMYNVFNHPTPPTHMPQEECPIRRQTADLCFIQFPFSQICSFQHRFQVPWHSTRAPTVFVYIVLRREKQTLHLSRRIPCKLDTPDMRIVIVDFGPKVGGERWGG